MDKIEKILAIILALLFVALLFAYAEASTEANKAAMLEHQLTVVTQERDNAKEMARQWREQYNASLLEIAEYKEREEQMRAAAEEVVHWAEETTAAMDDMIENGFVDLGTFQTTYYCNCVKCCGKWAGGATASGKMPKEGRTIAVDPNVIPLGTKVLIDGKLYVAEDTGSAIKGKRIDIYVDSHERALELGVTHKTVKITA